MFLSHLFEAIDKRHASFCFGRMNPPTIGHEQLIKTVGREAGGGDYYIFTSQTQDSKKNPLDYQTKVRFLRALYPGMSSHFVYDTTLKTIMQVAAWLYNKGYRNVTFVAGSDRLPDFEELLNKYNGVEGGAVYYKFDTIRFASSGERDPDSEGVAGVSASAAREAARAGNYEAFAQAVDAGALTQQMYDAVRAGLGVSDNVAEGWKGALAGAALIGGIGTAMVASNPITIGDVTYQSSMQGPDSPAETSTAKVITHNGKKFLVWKGTGPKPSHRAWKYKEIKPEQKKADNLGFDKEKWKKPYELEPTDLWINEADDIQLQDKKIHTFLRAIVNWWNAQVPDKERITYDGPSMRVWTRGDGTRSRDPAKLYTYDYSQEVIDRIWATLTKLSGAKPAGAVSGEFGSSPHGDAIAYKGFILVKRQSKIEVMSRSRVTNPNSVWRQKPVAECSGYIPKNKKEARDPRWSNALTVDVTPDTPTKNAKALRLA